MAQRRRDEEFPALPAPSFTSLPDIAHGTIASFLPDGDSKENNRLRVSGVSRALLESYGGSLTCATLRDIQDGRPARLAALLRRQRKLKEVSVTKQETIPAFSQAIAQGCCRGVESMLFKVGEFEGPPVDQTHLNSLIGALEVDGALPALKKLVVNFPSTPTRHVVAKLAEALVGGTLPLLEHLEIGCDDMPSRCFTDKDCVMLANMAERRALIPGCRGLTFFCSTETCFWLEHGTSAEIRLLRALLPSLKNLSYVCLHTAFDPCFRDLRPPHLEVLNVTVYDDDALPSLEMLEAAPALKEIQIHVESDTTAAFQPVIAALHRGVGLRNLEEIELSHCALGDGLFCDFLEALTSSVCAKRMMNLQFTCCGIGVEGARALANILRGDGLPALKMLALDGNYDMGDEGAAALACGLGEAPRTMLTNLELDEVGMGDGGMVALASVIYQGRMQEMEDVNLSEVPGMTDKGLIALARAINARGLPNVRQFFIQMDDKNRKWTALGFGALTLAFASGCPRLRKIDLVCPDRGQDMNFLNTMIQGMFQAAGRMVKVSV